MAAPPRACAGQWPDPLYPVETERGYQESPPFSKHLRVREEVLRHLAAFGIATKYVHGEVGGAVEDGRQLVQHEIELLPVPIAEAADALVLGKWLVREVAHAHGLEATFAPSVSSDGAGNGLHIHSRLVRTGSGGDVENVIVDGEGLTDTGRRLVAGYLGSARALTAVGNTVPTSYLRFAEGEESPEGICWGETDRTGLVRVPLAWVGDVLPGMVGHANADVPADVPDLGVHPQTVELRLGDGSAEVHLLLAGRLHPSGAGPPSSGRPPMRPPSRPSALLAALLGAVVLTACSGEVSVGEDTVSQSEIEEVVAGNITGEDADAVEVACEGDLDAEVGATQDCLATLDGSTTGIRVTVDQVNDQDVDFSSTIFITADELAVTVEDTYVGQGVSVDTVTCDGELFGEPGETASCEVTSAVDGDATIEATTTTVEGLTVNFDLEVVSQG